MRSRTKLTIGTALIASALLLGSTAASAAVNFDSTTGTGFVGKGDVQLAFGWNNKALQDYAGGVTFSYVATETYSAVCTFQTGGPNPQTQTPTRTIESEVSGSVAYDSRKNNQGSITGFNLSGFSGTPTIEGTIPEVGGSCPGGPNGGTYTSVSEPTVEGGLIATYEGTSVTLQ